MSVPADLVAVARQPLSHHYALVSGPSLPLPVDIYILPLLLTVDTTTQLTNACLDLIQLSPHEQPTNFYTPIIMKTSISIITLMGLFSMVIGGAVPHDAPFDALDGISDNVSGRTDRFLNLLTRTRTSTPCQLLVKSARRSTRTAAAYVFKRLKRVCMCLLTIVLALSLRLLQTHLQGEGLQVHCQRQGLQLAVPLVLLECGISCT